MRRYSFDPEQQRPIGFGRPSEATGAPVAMTDNSRPLTLTTSTTVEVSVLDADGQPRRLLLTAKEARSLAYDIERAARDAELKAKAGV